MRAKKAMNGFYPSLNMNMLITIPMMELRMRITDLRSLSEIKNISL